MRTTDNLRDQNSFDKWVDKKKKTTDRLIDIYSRLQDDIERDDIADKYERDIYGTKYKKIMFLFISKLVQFRFQSLIIWF